MGEPEKTEVDAIAEMKAEAAAQMKAEMAAEMKRRREELENAAKTKRIDIERAEVEALAKGKLNGKEGPKAEAKTKFDKALEGMKAEAGKAEEPKQEEPKAEDEEEGLKAEAPVPGTDLGPEEERSDA
jgi:hypothetical protein